MDITDDTNTHSKKLLTLQTNDEGHTSVEKFETIE